MTRKLVTGIAAAGAAAIVVTGWYMWQIRTAGSSGANRADRQANQAGKCENEVVKIQVQPGPGWECKSENLTAETGVVVVKSEQMLVSLGNGDRQPYCTSEVEGCETTEFVQTEKYTLDSVAYQASRREVYGRLKDKPVWISVKWANMETQELAAEKRAELENLLGSVK